MRDKVNTDASLKSLRKKVILLAVALAVCLVAAICYHLYRKQSPYISASEKRPQVDVWKPKVAEDFDEWLDSFVVECPDCLDEDRQWDEAYVRISHDDMDQTWIESTNQSSPKKYFSGNDWVELSHGGRLRVTHLMFSHGKPDNNNQSKSELYQLPYREGDSPLENSEMMRGKFPYQYICPSFEFDGVVNRSINGGGIYDLNSGARKLVQRSQSFSEGHFVSGYGINVACPVSFYRNVGFPFDITYGEEQEFELPLIKGSVIDVVGGKIAYVSSVTTRYAGYIIINPITGKPKMNIGLSDPDPGHPKTMIVLAKSTSNMPRFCRVKVKLKTGTEEKIFTVGGGLGFDVFAVHAKPEDLLSISFTQRPYHDSFVYEINQIPGIDKEYRPHKNLLKTRVEYVQIPSDYELERWLSTAVQLYIRNEAGGSSFPAGYFPKVFEDVTVEEILKEYQKHINKPTSAIIDVENGHLIFKKNQDQGWLKPTLDKTF
jgi:hypothetical protein